MLDNPAKEAYGELTTYLEYLETQTRALLHFLKDDGIVTDEKLAPYLEQASKASEVRMRAVRARMDRLFTAEDKAKSATDVVPQDTNKTDASQQRAAQSPEQKKDREEKPELPPQQRQPAETEPAEAGSKDKTTEKPAATPAKQKDAA